MHCHPAALTPPAFPCPPVQAESHPRRRKPQQPLPTPRLWRTHLRCVCKVPKLRLPQHQAVGVLHAVPQLKAQHTILAQAAVGAGELEGLLPREHMREGDVLAACRKEDAASGCEGHTLTHTSHTHRCKDTKHTHHTPHMEGAPSKQAWGTLPSWQLNACAHSVTNGTADAGHAHKDMQEACSTA